MTVRKCSTCKHYEPAPIWRKGWCRNPVLYAPQQSHLVGEDDLDCERGMGNYWELATNSDVLGDDHDVFPLHLQQPGGGVTIDQPRRDRREILTSTSGQPIYSVSGSSGYGPDPDDDLPPPRGSAGGPPTGRERQLDYYSDDRYWTDYLRIAAPILGVLLILVLFWFWAQSFFGDDDDNGNIAGTDATQTLPIISASPTQTTPVVGATGTPRIVVTSPPQTTQPSGGETAPTNTSEPQQPEPGGGEIAPGATVRVANTGGTGVNLRAEASTEAGVVSVLLDGTELTVTGESVEAEGFVWWPVSSESGDGYVAADYLELVR